MKLSEKVLTKAGTIALGMIEENIAKGVDVNGKAYKYSTKPFFMPYNKKIVSRLGGKSGEGKLYDIVHSKKSGKLGMIILGGYADFKLKVYPDMINNFLEATGKMLRDMKIVNYTDNGVILGFWTKENSDKAFYLNISGAGRSRKLWKFFGLSNEQKNQLAIKMTPDVTKEVANELAAKLQTVK